MHFARLPGDYFNRFSRTFFPFDRSPLFERNLFYVSLTLQTCGVIFFRLNLTFVDFFPLDANCDFSLLHLFLAAMLGCESERARVSKLSFHSHTHTVPRTREFKIQLTVIKLKIEYSHKFDPVAAGLGGGERVRVCLSVCFCWYFATAAQ